MSQKTAIERVDHIGIRVRDIDRALNFYRVLGFVLLRRAEGDNVAIVRNGNGVELNLIFNANAGEPSTNTDGRSSQISGLHPHGASRGIHSGNDCRSEGQRHRDHTGTGQLWRKRTDLGFRPRSGL